MDTDPLCDLREMDNVLATRILELTKAIKTFLKRYRNGADREAAIEQLRKLIEE